MELRRVQHRNQIFTYTDHVLHFPAAATQGLLDILRKWQTIFPREETLIQKRCDVPSLFVRFDCMIDADGTLRIYELQEGCAWIGYTGVANAAFRDIRDSIVRSDWPRLKVMRSQAQTDTDDELWLERVAPKRALREDYPLVVRSRLKLVSPDERTALIARSVRPVLTHNDKTYGIRLGWWRQVGWESTAHGETLPWQEEFVLKPLDGHGSIGIMAWRPDDRAGRSTRTQILRVLAERKEMLLQPLYPPMRMGLDSTSYNFIYRPYFAYSVGRRDWMPIHGVWTARPYPAFRIHGASDAISGPLHAD